MNIGKRGLDMIKSFEGLELEAYYDAVGVLTIGYGSTGNHVYLGQEITQQEAEALLIRDLVRFEDGIARMVKVPLTQNQYDALCSWCFNLGLGALAGSTMLRKLNGLDYEGAADEMLRWDKAGGKVLAGLTRRRRAEKALFLEA